jgi:dTDP-glucose pyrophosphorylase
MKPSLLVLAAGIGSRYGGLKQIDPVGPSGEIIIDYSVYDAVKAGFGKIVFVIRKDIEADFRAIIGKRFEGKIPVEYAFQELGMLPDGFSLPPDRKKPWGTGHAILAAEKNIDTPFAVINADDFYGASGYALISKYLSTVKDGAKAEYCMVGYVLRNTLSEFGTVARGVCAEDKDGFLTGVVEMTKIGCAGGKVLNTNEDGSTTPLTGQETASLNLWGFTPSLFGHLRSMFKDFLKKNTGNLKAEFFIPTVVNDLVDAGKARVKILKSHDQWFGVTYREDKPEMVKRIRALVDAGKYPEKIVL